MDKDREQCFVHILEKLKTAASSSFTSLKQEAEKQQQHIYRYTLPDISQPCSSKIDRTSLQLYPEQDVLCQGFLPMKIYGDGNCLCRTGSMYIFGSENNHIELRARVVVEMAFQKDWYLVQDKGQYSVFSHSSLPSDLNSSDGYERSTRKFATEGEWGEIWHLMALSSVLGCDVVSVYPDLIGTVRDRHLFHKIIKPRFRRSNDTVRIMWTSLATQSKNDRWWLPNHFVACTKATIEEAQPSSHQKPAGLTLADFFYPKSSAKNNRQKFKMKNTKMKTSNSTNTTVHKQDKCENLVPAKIIEASTSTNTNTTTVNLEPIHKLDLADNLTKVKSEPILSMNHEPNKTSYTNIGAMEPEIIHKDDKSENMAEAGHEKVSQIDTEQDISMNTNVTEEMPDTVCEQDEPENRTATGSEPFSHPDTSKELDFIMNGKQNYHEDLPENLLYEYVSFQFYYKMGRLAALNESRDKTRYLNPIEKDKENVDKKVKRTLLKETIISKLEPLQKKMMCEVKGLKRAHISAIKASGRYILDHGPIVKTQTLCNVFFNAKDSYQGIEVTVKRRKMSIELLETLSKYLPVMQIYINKTAYIMEYRSGDIQEFVDTVTEAVNFREVANRNLEETLDSLQDYMKFVDTVLDRNIIRSILVELYSVISVSHLEGAKSKQTLRRARDEIPKKIKTFKDLKRNLMTVRNDMNNNQQQNLHKRLVSKMKAKKFKSRAKGAGRQKIADKSTAGRSFRTRIWRRLKNTSKVYLRHQIQKS